MGIREDLLEILACPACKSAVIEKNDMIVCQTCHLKYPIRNGIPIMLIEEASQG